MKETKVWCLTKVDENCVPLLSPFGNIFDQLLFEDVTDVFHWFHIGQYKKLEFNRVTDSYMRITCTRNNDNAEYYDLRVEGLMSWNNTESVAQ